MAGSWRRADGNCGGAGGGQWGPPREVGAYRETRYSGWRVYRWGSKTRATGDISRACGECEWRVGVFECRKDRVTTFGGAENDDQRRETQRPTSNNGVGGTQ